MENPCKILCFGDSLTAGYAPFLEKRFKEEFPDIDVTVVNCGGGEETSTDGLKRLSCILAEKPNVALICFGMNDQAKGITTVDLAENLAQMIAAFEVKGARVLLLTINPMKGSPDSTPNARIDSYNQIIKDVAYEKRVRIVDVSSLWKRELVPWDRGLADSVHPNQTGYELCCRAITSVVSRPSTILLWQYNGNPCKCNYSCPYCTYDPKTQKGDFFRGTIDGWRRAFKDAFGNQHLVFYLAHGEPMAGERFFDVVGMIGDEPNWGLRMTSNISGRLDELVKSRVAREGRLNVNASFHPTMVKIEVFIERALLLRDHGIEVPIVYVMWPPFFERFKSDLEIFDRHGFLVHLRRFQGVFKGRTYPQGYTEEERRFMAPYMDDVMIKHMLSWESSYGKLTWSGVDFFIIDNEGNVGYCDDFRPDRYCLGNIFGGTLKPLTAPQPFPGRVSDGTVDGVANFLELNYRQLNRNNVLNFARQGGVYHTEKGVHYGNLDTDFSDPRIRAEYHFPPRDIRDCYYIVRCRERTLSSRLQDIGRFMGSGRVGSKVWRTTACTTRGLGLARAGVAIAPYVLISILGLSYGLFRSLPGTRMHLFAWRCSMYLLKARDWGRMQDMILNSVSFFRHVEFDFALRAVSWANTGKVLDVSSPRLLSAYLLARYPKLRMRIINPDHRDLAETIAVLDKCGLTSQSTKIHCQYPSDLPEEEHGSYDIVYSLSVVEHVADADEREFLLKLWSLVRPGGTLLLTVPVAASHRDEYRREDMYGQDNPRNDKGDIFFQRCYDAQSLQAHIFAAILQKPRLIEVYGIAGDWKYDDYVRRVMRRGLRETAKDAYYVARHVKRFDSTEALPDRGVCCMAFVKNGLATQSPSAGDRMNA